MLLKTRPILSINEEELKEQYYDADGEEHDSGDEAVLAEYVSKLLREHFEYFKDQVKRFLYEAQLYGVYYLDIGGKKFFKYIEKLDDLYEYINDRDMYMNINVYLNRIEINDYIKAYNTTFMEQDTLEMILYDEETHSKWIDIEEELYVETKW